MTDGRQRKRACIRSHVAEASGSMTVHLKLLTAQIVGMFVIFALTLFLAAGTVLWPAGWAFLVLFFGFTLALSRWLLKHNPGLLTERMTGIGKPNQKTWDKVFYGGANLIFLAWLVLMPVLATWDIRSEKRLLRKKRSLLSSSDLRAA
jgi:hypothetical protein